MLVLVCTCILVFVSANLLRSVMKFKWLYLLLVQGVESSV